MDSEASGETIASKLERIFFHQEAEPRDFPLSFFWEITDNFSEKLEIGRGGFAVVYKAKLKNGVVVAVKRLTETSKYEKEFNREIECLLKVKNRNIVRFLGYCINAEGIKRINKNNKMDSGTQKERLLCFEYLKRSLRPFIKVPSEGLEWRDRYQIIKGICEGLDYLHGEHIMHLDLKPDNILLDDNLLPKITDFGLSRCLDPNRTHLTTKKLCGTYPYLAPEHGNQRATYKLDLYSLGMIILEILTGKTGYNHVARVKETWNNRLDTTHAKTWWKQIEVCAEIGIECIDSDPEKRPADMKYILGKLNEMEKVTVIPASVSRLLNFHPYGLYFPFEPKKPIFSQLELTNNTDKYVIFRLASRESSRCFLELPVYGIVPPRSSYTLMLKALTKDKPPPKEETRLLLHCTELGGKDIQIFQKNAHNFFDEAKRKGRMVQVVTLLALCILRQETATSSKKISPGIKILPMDIIRNKFLCSLDANQDKQWIITGEDHGYVRLFNYQKERKVDSLRVSTETVTCVKFIKRMKWFVVATRRGDVHVYTYEQKMQKIKSFRAADESIISLAVHQTQPYLLSASNPCLPRCREYKQHCKHNRNRVTHRSGMKLWDWGQGWKCIKTFEDDNIFHVAFSSNDSIASCGFDDHEVKVWSLDSSIYYIVLICHSGRVNCLDFFTRDRQEYFVTGSDDRTAKVWDLQKKIHNVRTLTVPSPVRSILYQAKLEILVTGLDDRTFYFWSATDFRLNRVIDIGCLIEVQNLACLVQSVAIGNEHLPSVIMDLDNATTYQKESTGDCSETQVTEGSTSKLPLLGVHPLELHFPPEPNKSVTCLLHLTNNTDGTVAFRLINKVPAEDGMDRLSEWQLFDSAVPPKSNYTLVVTTTKQMKKPKNTDFRLVLQTIISADKYLVPFANDSECRTFFDEAKQMGKEVRSRRLKVVYDPSQKETQSKPAISPRMKVCSHLLFPMIQEATDSLDRPEYRDNCKDQVCSVDAHPTEPWIITGHFSGKARLWNYDSQSIEPCQVQKSRQYSWWRRKILRESSFSIPTDYLLVSVCKVVCVKVIATKKHIMFATGNSRIYVYSYVNLPGITNMREIRLSYLPGMRSIVLHAALPDVMTFLELVEWSNNYLDDLDEKQKLDAELVKQVAFNPEDPNSFASAELSRDDPDRICIVKVWSIGKPPVVKYTLSGHSAEVSCLDFFTRDDRQYLITGSKDCTAKIWDLHEKKCIHTMEAIMSPVIAVLSLPGRPCLVTATESGIVQVWNSTDFSLKRIINIGGGGSIRGLVSMMGSKSVLIGQEYKLSIMDIEEDVAAPLEGSN